MQNGLNALHLVAKDGNVTIATELLKAGIDPNAVTRVSVIHTRHTHTHTHTQAT